MTRPHSISRLPGQCLPRGERLVVPAEQFSPDRKETKAFPQAHMANSFIGNMLRVELLSRAGRIPLANRQLKLRREKGNNTLRYQLSILKGYRVKIDNRSGRKLVRMQ